MISIALAMAAASVAEQMAPAKQGMIQCQSPDVLFKTCMTLSKVSQTSPSTYSFDTEFAIDAHVIARTRTKTFVRGSEVCELMGSREVADSSFTSDGRALSSIEASPYRAMLRRRFAIFNGKTICTEIVADEQGSATVVGTIDGKRFPAGDYPMKWVAPDDGWKVMR